MTLGHRRPPRRRSSGGGLGRWLRGIALVLLAVGLGLAGLLWSTIPASNTRLQLPGLSASVEITLDAQGVPRIRAENEHDAHLALGWLHARDRMFQMELMRRGASGRLAEIAGPVALRNDRFVRTLGLARRAEADLATLPPETRAALDAYAAGVNAWITAHGRRAAPEFLLLGQPEPWRPEHSLLWAKIMGVSLSGDWRVELERARLAGIIPPDRIAELWPTDASPGLPGGALGPPRAGGLDPAHLTRLAAAVPRFPEAGTLPNSASNAWALAGSRSASGAPLLASDPHLGFSAPILWYLARIDLPGGRMLAGATSPGVPFIIIGRNERLAWGFTTTHADTQDVFEERLVGADRYLTPEGPRAFIVHEETIRVRGAEPVTLRVRESRHGPVLSDLDAAPPTGGFVVAVAMANLAPDDTAAAGLHQLNRATSMAEARTAAQAISSPVQNLMVADAAGPIGMFITGRIPVRAAGDGSQPSSGADGAHDWTGWIPFDELPHQDNPESGALVNANNRVVPPGSEVFLGRDWFGDWRFRRIGQLLSARPRFSAEEVAAVQLDTVSLLARDLLRPADGIFRRMPRPPGAAGAALDLLLTWDNDALASTPQPLIFNAWMRQFRTLALAAGGVPAGGFTAARPEFLRWVITTPEAAAAWCAGDCPAMASRALAATIAELSLTEGPDPTAWRWGHGHVARFEHPMLRFLPGLQSLTRLEVATPGDGETISRGGFPGSGPNPWAHVHGAGLRLVADLGSPDRTLAIIATGQSGHPFSGHWGDLLQPWHDGAMVLLGREARTETGRIALRPPPDP